MSGNAKSVPFNLAAIRNIGIIAHIDAGKTTLSERFLYYTGKTHRIGDVDSGNTVMDYLDEERNRGITIVAAAASFNWRTDGTDYLIHLIDTPGHIDFTAEVERSIRVIDGSVVIFSAVEGVEAQSEKVWRQSDRYHVPKIAFVNKMDRTGALDEIREKFTAVTVVPVQLPIGAEGSFSGVVDLIKMKTLQFTGEDGSEVVHNEISAELMQSAAKYREEMLSLLAEHSDVIADFYLNGREIPEDVMRMELRKLLIANKVCPVFVGAAKKNIGVQPLLDAVTAYLPGPEDVPDFPAEDTRTGKHIHVNINDDFFSGLIFKIVAGGSADLLYLRTYSGKLSVNDTLLNARTGEKVRVKRILRLYAKNVEAIDEIGPGDIVGITGPQDVRTGDTLCDVRKHLLLEKITFPEPVLSIALEPKSIRDKDKLANCLAILCREDPTLHTSIHENTGQMILAGMGELHLEINTNRIKREFNIEAKFGAPRVAFRETLKELCKVTGVFDKVLGETELFAEVDFILEPVNKLEKGIEVTSLVKHKNMVPHAWIKAAEDALNNGLRTGGNWGYPLINIKAVLNDVRGTSEKTTENAIAGAVLDGLQKAISLGTILLEPVMKLEIISPEESVGEITGYLQAKRAVIEGLESINGVRKLDCEVPLAEMFGFSKALPKLSGGRAGFSMEPCGYQEISQSDMEKISFGR